LGGDSAVKGCILLFLVLFSWPFLGVLDIPAYVLGIPLFPVAVFVFWAILVYVLLGASRRAGE